MALQALVLAHDFRLLLRRLAERIEDSALFGIDSRQLNDIATGHIADVHIVVEVQRPRIVR
jgi:hypothetical protein